jgi:hypothetical protein
MGFYRFDAVGLGIVQWRSHLDSPGESYHCSGPSLHRTEPQWNLDPTYLWAKLIGISNFPIGKGFLGVSMPQFPPISPRIPPLH